MLDQVYTLNKVVTYAAIFFSGLSLICLWLAKRSLNRLSGLEEDSTFSLKRNHLLLKEKVLGLKKELAEERRKNKSIEIEHNNTVEASGQDDKVLLKKRGKQKHLPSLDEKKWSGKDQKGAGKDKKRAGADKKKKALSPIKKKIVKRPENNGILGETQLFQFNELLAPGPKGNVDIVAILDDDNSYVLAGQINDILLNNGWTTNGVTQRYFSTPPCGIQISVHSKETAPTYAVFLQRIFEIIGIKTTGSLNRKIQEWSVTMIIGNIRTQ